VRIGTINSIGIYFLPDILQAMRERYPGARPTILYRDSQEIQDTLATNETDLVLMANPLPDSRFHQEVILTERVSLVCGRSHPFFRRKSITPDELKGLDFVSLTPLNPTGRLVRDYFARIGVYVEPVVSTDNIETVKKMAEIGLGAAFLPDMVIRRTPLDGDSYDGGLARIEVPPLLTRQIVLLTLKKHELSPVASAFVEELRSCAASWANPLLSVADAEPKLPETQSAS
jgi:DNA-binding transcriptional LysR family regulator